MRINKALVRDRYNRYGKTYASHVRNMGGTQDEVVKLYLGPTINQKINLLDVAGGDGLSTSLLDPDKVDITIMDLSPELLNVARETRANVRSTLIHDFDEVFPYGDHTFDCVTCVSALEFATNLEFTLSEMVRVTKSKGRLLFSIDLLGAASSIQKDAIYMHDPNGFFSRRYSEDEVNVVINRLGLVVLKYGRHDAYMLENQWVKYGYYLVERKF